MKTSFTILLTPQQLKALQRGERITIEIGVSKEGVHHPVETERQASAEVRTNLPSFLEFFQQRIDRQGRHIRLHTINSRLSDKERTYLQLR